MTSDQGRTLYGVGQTASITTKASDASGLKTNPSRKNQKLATSKPGTFTVHKTATDTCNHSGSATFRYHVVAGPTATVVHVPAPAGCRARLIALGRVTSPVSLRGSQIFVDGKLKATSRKKVLTATILTRRLRNGRHKLLLV